MQMILWYILAMAIDWTKICKKYRGLWVGLKSDKKTVVASGRTVMEVMEKSQRSACFFGSRLYYLSTITHWMGNSRAPDTRQYSQ